MYRSQRTLKSTILREFLTLEAKVRSSGETMRGVFAREASIILELVIGLSLLGRCRGMAFVSIDKNEHGKR